MDTLKEFKVAMLSEEVGCDVRYIQQLKVPTLSSSGNVPSLSTIIQHVLFELLGVSQLTPDLINRPIAYCCIMGNFRKGIAVLG